MPVLISPGELLDRITILRIRRRHFSDNLKLRQIDAELRAMEQTFVEHVTDSPRLGMLATELAAVNEALWAAEDRVRQCRSALDHPGFVACSESILQLNDVSVQ